MADKKISQLTPATLPLAGTELLPIVQNGTTDNITVNNLAAGNIKSNATTGVLQVTGPAAASTRVMTTPDANFTVARTDAANTFTGVQTFSNDVSATNGIIKSPVAMTLKVNDAGSTERTTITLASPIAGSTQGFTFTNGKSGATYPTLVATGGTISTQSLLCSDNVVIGTSGKGIDFSATASGSGTMTSELLSDYEEGTWTPSLGGDTTYTTQTGHYVKIGKMVFVSCILQVNVLGTGNNKVISGLPYSCTQNGSGSVHYFGSLATSLVDAVAYTDVNSGLNVYFRTLTAAAATMGNATMFQNGSRIDFTLMYQAA